MSVALLLGLLLVGVHAARGQAPKGPPAGWPAPRPIDADRLARFGLRTIEGEHLTLVTDLPAGAEVDGLPGVVDAGVGQIATYCGVPPERLNGWRVQACLIGDRNPFDAAGLMPQGNDAFVHGLSMGHEVWLYDQPTAYYRRHLLLHEVTHSLMATLLGGCGPGWYMEGVAELLATHHWDAGRGALTLRANPAGPDAAPHWGRVGLIQDAADAGRALSVASVLRIDNRRHLENEAYAWVWALAYFLDTHPRYRERFRGLPAHVLDPAFSRRFRDVYAHDWGNLRAEWALFTATLQYGHDVPREAIAFRRGEPLPATGARVGVAADRGWQSTGVLVERGRPYRVEASGRFTILREGATDVPCEAQGITLTYHAGRPLGVLLAAVDDRDPAGSPTPSRGADGGFLRPVAVGPGATLTPERSGTLYLRVNDSPAQLSDNAGRLTVRVRRFEAGAPDSAPVSEER